MENQNLEQSIQKLKSNQSFVCENKQTIIEILYAANEIIPQKLPFQKIIIKNIIIPAIDKLLQIVCYDKLDKLLNK
jgi:hypothetical protein